MEQDEMKGTFEKYFTPEEANRTLPLVKRVVKDILDASHEVRSIATILGKDAEGHPDVEALIDTIKSYFAELESIGCFYKDWNFEIGLVDFPAIIDDEEVFLCWRSDEGKILYYHDIDEGYSGRKPIPQKYFSQSIK